MTLKVNKTRLYELVAESEPVPGIRRTSFQKGQKRGRWMLYWEFCGSLQAARLIALSSGAALVVCDLNPWSGEEVSRKTRYLDVPELRQRGMVEA